MLKQIKQVYLIILIILLSFGCQSKKLNFNENKEVLIKVIDSALKLDSGLNTPNYWIDFSRVQYFKETTIDDFLQQRRNFTRINADSLFQNDSTWLNYEYLDKLLITIKSVNEKGDLIIITLDKILSSDGSNGIEIILKKSKNNFVLISSRIIWIS